jgi:tetratricopeptide (TPR) repeat protein
MKLGRNAPCPCGSGLKYKKCCLEEDRLAASAPHPLAAKWRLPLRIVLEDDGFEELYFGVHDCLKEGRLDEAEAAARKIEADSPEDPSGIHLLGMVYEARGDTQKALDCYRAALDLGRGCYRNDEETEEKLLDAIQRLAGLCPPALEGLMEA